MLPVVQVIVEAGTTGRDCHPPPSTRIDWSSVDDLTLWKHLDGVTPQRAGVHDGVQCAYLLQLSSPFQTRKERDTILEIVGRVGVEGRTWRRPRAVFQEVSERVFVLDEEDNLKPALAGPQVQTAWGQFQICPGVRLDFNGQADAVPRVEE